MNKEITSKIIGQLKQDNHFSDWWTSDEIEIPFFSNTKLPFIFIDYEPEQDKHFIDAADQALENFLKLTISDRNLISELAYRNCMEFLEAVEFDEADNHLREIENPNDIWDFIQPIEIYIKRRAYQEQDVYVQVICECDWDKEHGLQLVFRQGKKLTRISYQDGHLTEADAEDKPDEEDKLLSEFNQ
jgi:hypothetical protein